MQTRFQCRVCFQQMDEMKNEHSIETVLLYSFETIVLSDKQILELIHNRNDVHLIQASLLCSGGGVYFIE